MKAASDDGRLLKKVAPGHRQPLTSKPAFPDWTRTPCFWFSLHRFSLLTFALLLLPLRFSLLLPAIRPTAPLPSHYPLPLFPLLNQSNHHSLIKLFSSPFPLFPSRIPSLPHYQDTITLHLFRPPSLGPSATSFPLLVKRNLEAQRMDCRF